MLAVPTGHQPRPAVYTDGGDCSASDVVRFWVGPERGGGRQSRRVRAVRRGRPATGTAVVAARSVPEVIDATLHGLYPGLLGGARSDFLSPEHWRRP